MNGCVSECMHLPLLEMRYSRICTPGLTSITLVFVPHGTQAGEAAWRGLESYQSGGLAEGQGGEMCSPHG